MLAGQVDADADTAGNAVKRRLVFGDFNRKIVDPSARIHVGGPDATAAAAVLVRDLELSDAGPAPKKLGTSDSELRAVEGAKSWWDVDLGDGGGDSTKKGARGGNLSPLTVTPPQPPPPPPPPPLSLPPSLSPVRRMSDAGVVRVASTTLMGDLKLSPLTVQAPPNNRHRQRCELYAAKRPVVEVHDSSIVSPAGSSSSSNKIGGEDPNVMRQPPWREDDWLAGDLLGGVRGGGVKVPAPLCGPGLGASETAPAAASASGVSKKEQREKESSRRASKPTVDNVFIESLREDFDFEGRTIEPNKPSGSPFAAALSVPRSDDEQYLVFIGLGETGRPLPALAARAQFSANPGRQAERMVGPLQARAGSNGRVYGAVQYPSMAELWPEVYNSKAIRVVKVDMLVEVRSRSGDSLYLATELMAMYRRPSGGSRNQGALWRP
ncbi:unnamed protein product [Ectocarpus sp. CCAP 1310/34]|nr:unnamed protein product [Ectocarpus sp. CCAP 1310/34]